MGMLIWKDLYLDLSIYLNYKDTFELVPAVISSDKKSLVATGPAGSQDATGIVPPGVYMFKSDMGTSTFLLLHQAQT